MSEDIVPLRRMKQVDWEAEQAELRRREAMSMLCWTYLTDEETLTLEWEEKIAKLKELGVDTTDVED